MKFGDLHRTVRNIMWIKEGGRCVICGAPAIDSAHMFVRNRLNTAFDTQVDGNVHLLCRDCHDSDHRGSGVYRDWYVSTWGQVALDMLTRRANFMVGVPKVFIERKKDELERELDGLRRGLYVDAE